ncbi:MAG: tetratricopeptide repeat protein [Calothrix sp. MO_192.B10]|nr:tetratricopeptide repeat protein [Calothrix sp. MO_192.B10]
MLRRLWRWIKGLFQRLLGISPSDDSSVTTTEEQSPQLTDGEYESLLMELLQGVNDGWSRGWTREFLTANNISNFYFVEWLRGFGDRLLGGDGVHEELGRRMVLLGDLGIGELSQVAGDVGVRLVRRGEELNRRGAEDAEEEEGGDGKAMSEVDKLFRMLQQPLPQGLEIETNHPKVIIPIQMDTFNIYNAWAKNITDLWLEEGNRLVMVKDFMGAVVSYNKAIEIKPDFYIAWYNLGLVLNELGRSEEAITSYDKVIEFKRDFYLAWYHRGEELFNLGRYQEAIASYEQALDIKPDYHDAWCDRGINLGLLGKHEEALASFDKAIEIKPDLEDAWYGRGVTLSHFKRYEEALASYDKAIELKPDFYQAMNNRGLVLDNLGRYEEEISSFDKAIEIKPDFYIAWYHRGLMLGKLGRYKEAPASFDKAIEIKPDFHDAWLSRGAVLCDHLQKYEEALTSFDKAIEIKSNYHDALYNRGNALGHLGRHEEAIASYDKAVAIKPDFHHAWLTRGNAAGKSVSYDPLLSSTSNIVKQNPLLNERGYEGILASYEEGLKHCFQETHPEGWGLLHQAIGKAHYYQGVGKANYRQYWHQATDEYHQALITLTKEAFPELHLKLLQELIRVLFGLNKNEEAKQWRREGLQVFAQLLNSPDKSSFQKRRLESEFSGFSQMRVDVLIEDDDFIPALETAERNKNFCLTWILDNQQQHILSPSYSEIKKLINPHPAKNTAIIYWHLSPFALTTFIIKPGASQPTVIPTQKPDKLEGWIKNWDKQYANYPKGKDEPVEEENNWRNNLPNLLEELTKILDIASIINAIDLTPQPPSLLGNGENDSPLLVGEGLGERSKSKIQNLILVPHRDLHRLPLHALFPDNFTITYLPSVQIGISLAELSRRQPNTNSPTKLLSVEHPNSTDSEDKPFPQLFNAEIESATITRMFPNHQRLADNHVTQENLVSALKSGHDIFHFTGHGTYNFHNPQASALALSGEDRLTLTDILQLPLSNYCLVSLSACETAVTGNQTITTEYVGLVSAFLFQGVSNVVSTLWTVTDDASSLVMIYFYWQLSKGKSPQIALVKATKWLRNLTDRKLERIYRLIEPKLSPNDKSIHSLYRFIKHLEQPRISEMNEDKKKEKRFENPYYWASFIITG